jgi:hypothetical protein
MKDTITTVHVLCECVYITSFTIFSCFVRLAEGFEVKRNHEMEVGEISQYFPHFIWLLRDVSLITSDDGEGGEMDPTDYIKKKVFDLHIFILFLMDILVIYL